MDPSPEPKAPIATPPQTRVGAATFIKGGLGAVRGLRTAGVHAGFRRNPGRLDFALITTDTPAVASALFTQNRFVAAPVLVSRKHLELCRYSPAGQENPKEDQGARAIIINSGQANASTGQQGLETAMHSAVITAEALGCAPHQVLVASTGVIGSQLELPPFQTGVTLAIAALGPADGSDLASGAAAATAIMTTDTYPKEAAVTFCLDGAQAADGVDGSEASATASAPASADAPGPAPAVYHIGGMVKGSGMIEPHMATLLGVFATDAALTQEASDAAFKAAIDVSLNRVTIDSDTSTNDSAFFLATGAAAGPVITLDSPQYPVFAQALRALCIELARLTAYDGEGATKLLTVEVGGALSDAQADLAARAVANSPLVKTAVAGHDANWGRIAMALGKSGAEFDQGQVSISIMGLEALNCGQPVAFDEAAALERFNNLAEVVVEVDLGTGQGGFARIYSCDLTHGYVSINGDYRS